MPSKPSSLLALGIIALLFLGLGVLRLVDGSSSSDSPASALPSVSTDGRPADPATVGSLIAFSPDGGHIAFVRKSGRIDLYSAETHKLQRSTVPPDGTALGLAVGPNARSVAVTRLNGAVVMWDTAKNHLRSIPGIDALGPIVFSRDGTKVTALGADSKVGVWSVGTGEFHVTSPQSKTPCSAEALSPDGLQVACAHDDPSTGKASTVVWDVETGKTVVSLPAVPIATSAGGYGHEVLAFSPDGGFLALGEDTVEVWGLASARSAGAVGSPADGRIVALSRYGQTLVLAEDKNVPERTIEWWQTSTPRLEGILPAFDDLWSVAFGPDGDELAVLNGNQGSVWSLRSGKKLWSTR